MSRGILAVPKASAAPLFAWNLLGRPKPGGGALRPLTPGEIAFVANSRHLCADAWRQLCWTSYRSAFHPQQGGGSTPKTLTASSFTSQFHPCYLCWTILHNQGVQRIGPHLSSFLPLLTQRCGCVSFFTLRRLRPQCETTCGEKAHLHRAWPNTANPGVKSSFTSEK